MQLLAVTHGAITFKNVFIFTHFEKSFTRMILRELVWIFDTLILSYEEKRAVSYSKSIV